jgi:hypothetical protein
MIALDTVSSGEFEACLHEKFSLPAADGKVLLELASVTVLTGGKPGAKRAPFSLIFKTDTPIRLPQGIYRLEHEKLGPMELFLVQVAPTDFEAIFS